MPAEIPTTLRQKGRPRRAPAARKRPVMAASKPGDGREAAPLWGALDRLLDAYAIVLDHEPALAGFIMIAAHAIGDRLGLSEAVVLLMGESAAAEARRTRRGRPPRRDG